MKLASEGQREEGGLQKYNKGKKLESATVAHVFSDQKHIHWSYHVPYHPQLLDLRDDGMASGKLSDGSSGGTTLEG